VRAVTIKAVLFDFDGVLTTDKTGSLTTTRFLSKRTGIDFARVQSVFRNFNDDLTLGKTTHTKVWESICEGLGKSLSIELLKEAFESTPMNARMLELARHLHPRYSVGIVTDNKKDRIDRLKQIHNLASLFDPIAVSAEIGVAKDSPEMFLGVLSRLNANPNECVFIDNSQENLIAPRSLGINTIYFDDETQDFEALSAALESLGVAVSDA
jgi:FMN phosphatase YigB (HAD superfamily)